MLEDLLMSSIARRDWIVFGLFLLLPHHISNICMVCDMQNRPPFVLI